MRVLAPAMLQHIQKTYGLAPPTSSSSVYRAAVDDAGVLPLQTSSFSSSDTPVDLRYWTLLHNTARRGPLGIMDEQGSLGWWGKVAEKSSLHASDTLDKTEYLIPGPVLSWNDVSPKTRGILFLHTHVSLSSGKRLNELVACGYHPSKRLHVLAVSSSSGRTLPESATSHDPHTSMVQSLPFNLAETKQQRERRENVPLPYTYQLNPAQENASLRGSTGQSAIFFEPESEDDEDDEDPDDDLDL